MILLLLDELSIYNVHIVSFNKLVQFPQTSVFHCIGQGRMHFYVSPFDLDLSLE